MQEGRSVRGCSWNLHRLGASDQILGFEATAFGCSGSDTVIVLSASDSGSDPAAQQGPGAGGDASGRPDASGVHIDASAVSADAALPADAAAPPVPGSTAVCDSSYQAKLMAILVSGVAPKTCNAGVCAAGECCFQGQFCLPA